MALSLIVAIVEKASKSGDKCGHAMHAFYTKEEFDPICCWGSVCFVGTLELLFHPTCFVGSRFQLESRTREEREARDKEDRDLLGQMFGQGRANVMVVQRRERERGLTVLVL